MILHFVDLELLPIFSNARIDNLEEVPLMGGAEHLTKIDPEVVVTRWTPRQSQLCWVLQAVFQSKNLIHRTADERAGVVFED